MKTLDDIDRHLIALLRDDARTPVVTLAKTVGLSRSALQERLQRLERSGVIAGYTVRLGEPSQSRVPAWLTLRFRDGYRCAQIVPVLAAMPDVRTCHSVAGTLDLVVFVDTGSIAELSALRERLASHPGIASIETLPVLATPIDRR